MSAAPYSINKQKGAIPMDEEEYLTLKELCRVFNRTEKTVRHLVRDRRIPYAKFGRTLLFPKSIIDYWLRFPKKALAEWWDEKRSCKYNKTGYRP